LDRRATRAEYDAEWAKARDEKWNG